MAIRWLAYVGLLGVIGTVVLARVVVPRAAGQRSALAARIGRRAGRWLAAAAALLLASAVLRLIAQVAVLDGGDPTATVDVPAMVMHTMWGWSWLLELAGVALALGAAVPARRTNGARWTLATLAAAVLALSFATGGHAVAVTHLRGLAVTSDALHVLAAGGWLGTLLILTGVAMPAAFAEPAGERGRAAADLVHAFSPVALCCAAVVAATGVVAAWMHLGTLAALWQSGYGRTLLVKLALVAAVAAVGAVNWRVLRPSLGTDGAAVRIRRSALLELAAGALVLAATAVLVAASPPAEMDDAMTGPQPSLAPATLGAAGPASAGITIRVRVPRPVGT